MLTETFTYNSATVTVRRADVRARLRAQIVFTTFGVNVGMSDEEWAEIEFLGRFLSQASVEGDLGFPMALVSDDLETLKACKEGLMTADDVLYDLINKALRNVRRNPGDPDLVPEDELDEPKKTTPPSSESETSS